MAKISIPFLVGKTNKAGITSWHWQPSATLAKAGFKSEALGKDATLALRRAQDKNREVDAWKAGEHKSPELKQRVHVGTLNHLMQRYRKERMYGINHATGRQWVKLSTARSYETALSRIEIWAGDQPLSYVTPKRVQTLRNTMLSKEHGIGHAPALNVLRTLRQLFAFAEGEDLIPKGSNPAANFELSALKGRKAVWEAEDEAAFIQAAYALNRPSMALALELAIFTAQREGDLILMNENQIRELPIDDPFVIGRLGDEDGIVTGWTMAQEKGNQVTQMEIPFDQKLLAKINATLRNNRARDRAAPVPRLLTHALIDDATGLAWTLCEADPKRPRGGQLKKLKEGEVRAIQERAGKGAERAFIRVWRKVIDKAIETTGRAHMANLVWHDLRRTRVVRLRRRGMAKEMIATITGHSLRSIEMMLEVYGPIDATITANAIATAMDPLPNSKPSNKNAQRA